jgi:hypothetical protein
VAFRVTLNCANDPLKSTAKEPNHYDYRYTAVVHQSALGGAPDIHPADDTCPRAPLGADPNPDGKIFDRGCGAARGDGTFGNPVMTDVVKKATGQG